MFNFTEVLMEIHLVKKIMVLMKIHMKLNHSSE